MKANDCFFCVNLPVSKQVAQVPLRTLNMTWRNSVIVRVCIGIYRLYGTVQNKWKK